MIVEDFGFKPQYDHDCNACKYLGFLKHKTDGLFDIYLCNSEGGTIIARFGSKPYMYRSMALDILEPVVFAYDQRSVLKQAYYKFENAFKDRPNRKG